MSETLGEKLKAAREKRGLTISEIAEETRISASYLECIEKDEYKTLPGGIFNKGFVKSFAKVVGVDPQEAVNEYLSQANLHQEIEVEPSLERYRSEVLSDQQGGWSNLPTIIGTFVVLGLMTWGLLALVRYYNSDENQIAEQKTTNSNTKLPVDNSNSKTPVGVQEEIPATDKITVMVETSANELAIKSTIDGKDETRLLNSAIKEQVFEAETSLRLSYYSGFADTVSLTINGKKIETPLPPADYRRNGFEYEITKNNLEQILREGRINFGAKTEQDSQGIEPATEVNTLPTNANRQKATPPPAPRKTPVARRRQTPAVKTPATKTPATTKAPVVVTTPKANVSPTPANQRL